jgi:FAD/FMN-containing dehydrogenase
MRRRNLLKTIGVLPFLPTFLPCLRAYGAGTNGTMRRVRPSDSTWPTATKWKRLKEDVGGNLIDVRSMFAACEKEPKAAACLDALKNVHNPFYIGDQPAGTEVSGWLDAWTSAPSAYAVVVENAADVAATVNFARENNLRLVVKGGGHSYQGTSNAADSLLIWTRRMNKITLHESFVAQGCAGIQAPVSAVTLEAGALWMDAYDAVTTKGGRYVQGGGCTTVGVAGLIQSGGFGSFSKGHGTAAAWLLEAELVTADGVVRILNACTNPDLFWAIKGGGGGSWGVVTKLTLRTHDLPSCFGSADGAIKAQSDTAFRALITRFIRFYSESLFNPYWGETISIHRSNTLQISMECHGLNKEQIAKVWQPFFDWVAESPGDYAVLSPLKIGCMPAQHYWDADYLESIGDTSYFRDPRPGAKKSRIWWVGDQEEVGEFWHAYQSIWLPASLLHEEQAKLSDALFTSSRNWTVGVHFNKGLGGADADALTATKDTATNPAVLNAFALAIISAGDPPAYPGLPGQARDLAAARMDAGKIDKAMNDLRKLAPGGGSYVSESNYFERFWQRSFWGENYERLRSIKMKSDPDGLFFVHHGVGSEDWIGNGFIRSIEH